MLQRGVVVSYETIRQWCAKFGQVYANRLRRRRARPGLATNGISMKSSSKINGTIHYLWRGRPARQCARRPGAVTPTRGGRQEVLPPTAHGTAVRAAGARHRQARQLRARPPRGDALGGTPAIEVSEPGRELASTDPATRAGDETVHLAPACATVPVRVQPHLATFPSAAASAVGQRMAPRDGRPLHRLEPDHPGEHDRRLNVNWDRAFHQNLRTTQHADDKPTNQLDSATASASWPSRSVCSGSPCAIATQGVVSADAKRKPDVAEASHRRSAGRRRDHHTPTPPGRWRPQRAPSSESAVGRLPSTWVSHRSIEPPRRPAATSPFPSVQVRSRPARSNPLAACPRVLAHACQHGAPPTAKHRPECAVLPHPMWPSTTPLSQSATPRVAKSTRSGRWSIPEQSAELTTSTRERHRP